MNKPFTLFFVLLLSGCASFDMQIMSRSDGKVYHGVAQRTGNGRGTATMDIAGIVYTGTFARTSSQEYLSFVGSYAKDNSGNRANAFGSGYSTGANSTYMAILSSPSGDGMRCAINSDKMSGTGGGTCVDARNNIYDVIYQQSGGMF